MPGSTSVSRKNSHSRAVDNTLDEDQWGLVAWVQDYIKEGNINHIVDSDISGEISPKCLKDFVRITETCLHNKPKQRPTMAEVVVSLESVLALQERFNSSLQPAGRTIFGGMVPSPSNRENYGRLSMKSDIYCFGVMLLESITAQKAMDVNRADGQQSLVDWASSIHSNRTKLEKIMDARLKHNYPVQGAFKCVALALRCAATKPKDRPSSVEVLQSLEQIYALYK
ncbi:hypothetical protein L1987_47930 [Smallanthus sonchifolius]|uniref:Uncharacterized protein n=1 Tax=Smallanthus sonchifolius TaxID=185202 RepID=A0ACB9FRG3_9ASTR|nr:hypothetical protein L1987_47930 [Smallanthus sonchifolius]